MTIANDVLTNLANAQRPLDNSTVDLLLSYVTDPANRQLRQSLLKRYDLSFDQLEVLARNVQEPEELTLFLRRQDITEFQAERTYLQMLGNVSTSIPFHRIKQISSPLNHVDVFNTQEAWDVIVAFVIDNKAFEWFFETQQVSKMVSNPFLGAAITKILAAFEQSDYWFKVSMKLEPLGRSLPQDVLKDCADSGITNPALAGWVTFAAGVDDVAREEMVRRIAPKIQQRVKSHGYTGHVKQVVKIWINQTIISATNKKHIRNVFTEMFTAPPFKVPSLEDITNNQRSRRSKLAAKHVPLVKKNSLMSAATRCQESFLNTCSNVAEINALFETLSQATLENNIFTNSLWNTFESALSVCEDEGRVEYLKHKIVELALSSPKWDLTHQLLRLNRNYDVRWPVEVLDCLSDRRLGVFLVPFEMFPPEDRVSALLYAGEQSGYDKHLAKKSMLLTDSEYEQFLHQTQVKNVGNLFESYFFARTSSVLNLTAEQLRSVLYVLDRNTAELTFGNILDSAVALHM